VAAKPRQYTSSCVTADRGGPGFSRAATGATRPMATGRQGRDNLVAGKCAERRSQRADARERERTRGMGCSGIRQQHLERRAK
jgi:hypothetical protein